MSSHVPEHYETYTDRQIYEALCRAHPELEHVFNMQRTMLLAGWSEARILDMLKEGGDAEFLSQLRATPGYLMKRALHHMATVLAEQRRAQQLKSKLN